MRSGTGRTIGSTLLACALAVAAAADAPSAGARGDAVESTLVRAAAPSGAGASGATTIFVIGGTPADNLLSVTADSTGRLVISSPQGITEPDGDAPECVQDSPTQVSCSPGFIGAIAGDLGRGDDTLTAQSTLTTLIGISLVSSERVMTGGPGRDRIVGALGGDLISGGSGKDTLLGFGGADLLRGQAGRDTLSGGGASDKLVGGKGRDAMNGGAAKDLCDGGPGIDTAKNCNATRKVP